MGASIDRKKKKSDLYSQMLFNKIERHMFKLKITKLLVHILSYFFLFFFFFTITCQLFDLILYIPVNNFSVYQDGSYWVETVLSRG